MSANTMAGSSGEPSGCPSSSAYARCRFATSRSLSRRAAKGPRSASAALSYWRRRQIDEKMMLLLGLGGLLGSAAGVFTFSLLRSLGQLDLIIALSYVAFLGFIGAIMLRESLRALWRSRGGRTPPPRPSQHTWIHGLPLKTRFRRSKLYVSIIPVIALGAGIGFLGIVLGTGGPTYKYAEEVTPETTYPRGTIAMAKSSAPASTGSQFFLCFVDTELPPEYTAVGTVDEAGLAVLDTIAAAGNDGSFEAQAGGGAPNLPVTINTMTVVG